MAPRQHFSESMKALNQEIVKMGTLVEEAVRKAVTALVDQDTVLATSVSDEDEAVNQMEMDIEDRCTILIATEQPVATDLRHIITALKIVTQLERMGDHAVHIANGVVRLAEETYMKPIIDIPRMSEIAIRMIHDVLTAFINGDADLAVQVAKRDSSIDELHHQVMREVLSYMMEDPHYIKQSTQFLFISRFLERIGDHVTNICEWIIYNDSGKHVELNRQ
ncbi:MAG TPA: phosphate signaling complex protein PhoU [Spirochaetia bacterium]|nr:phosphate signaling complex protein PhoU [Spirochaetia bacterium]